ncbi:hypothetical protein CKM354_000793000 [Cercospora kikuchii]|uniref:Uncharacterized protein n=1 Tax=Cercospora kikuchii TaxID=84275 RepID=A0A9P3CS32_9PEZI|nr:uncharacterized protein CKM354_000793000 [Cercospora kikuchii]GIZ44740.1 hypothetical protein CKM354_000793000 [Cercospora kikuchii]
MFLIATSFNGLDFAVSFFAPYSLLRGGSVPAARGIDFHVLGSFPPKALYKSLKRKHWASALSNSAGTLGGVLTIISSGLWLVDRDVVQEMAIRLPLAHSWNATWPDSSLTGDGGAGVTFNTIQHGGAVMGPLIWDDYVLPDLSTGLTIESETQETLVGSSSNYTFQVQALRPHLLCEAIDNDRTKVYRNEKDGAYTDLEFLFPLEGHCRRGGRYGENAYYNVSYSIYAKSAGASLWFGKLIDLHLGPFHNRTVSDGSSNTTEETLEFGEPSYGPDNIVGCPSVGVVLGPFNVSDGKKKASEFTALLCSQKVEQVALDVTYLGNQTRTPTLVGSDGPRRIEGQSHYLTNGTQGFESFAYRVQLYIGNLSAINASHGENPFSQVDGFVDNIVSGPGGVPFEELQGKDNQDNLINAVQKLYNKYMSLAIDANFRQAYSTPEEAEFVTGKLRIMTSRLQVNFVSKLILQIILAVMTLMGGLAFWLADLRGSLPRKPTSIASTMGFLASSKLCGSNGSASLIPKNAMQTEEKEFVNLFDGWLFSLGWWNTSTETDVEVVLDSGVVERAKKKRFGIDVGVPEQLGFRKRRRFQPA